MPKRPIVRSDAGGERLRLWVDAPTQAELRKLAERDGLTLAQAARSVLRAWALGLEHPH